MLRLKEKSLRWALTSALKFGDTDIFPRAFEFLAIDHDPSVVAELAGTDVLRWQTRPYRRCLTPKHRYGFRVATQLDPLDWLVYTALVYEIGNDLEAQRVPVSEEVVHSYRFAPTADGHMYDQGYSYQSFSDKSAELASNSRYSHVLIADIADFFPRLYSHRLENALLSSTKHANHALAIKHLIAQWNEHFSYGIPVGPAASRLISEVALDDVDRNLLAEGAVYVRYNDDFRIFCPSVREAHEKLALLARILFENHGLTLQQNKTRIVDSDTFIMRYVDSPRTRTIDAVTHRFWELLEEVGLDDPYDLVDWDDLSEDTKAGIEGLNLVGILREQTAMDEIDIQLCKFVFRALGQLQDKAALELVVEHMDHLYPVFPDVVEYIRSLNCLTSEERVAVGKSMVRFLETSLVSHLEFHRMWLLTLFSKADGFNSESEFVKLYNRYHDLHSRRELILALGRSNQDYWFRTLKREVRGFEPWQKRAMLRAGSSLPPDERRHWYGSLKPRLDLLETAVIKYAQAHPSV